MERILTRLERTFGRLAVENVYRFFVGGTALVFVLSMLKPGFEHALVLDLAAVRRGEGHDQRGGGEGAAERARG